MPKRHASRGPGAFERLVVRPVMVDLPRILRLGKAKVRTRQATLEEPEEDSEVERRLKERAGGGEL